MPDLVICFIPNEPALHAAFAADPELFDYALERNVLLVSPTSLIGLLRTMELGWRQERMVAEAAEIAEAAGTLHARFAKFLGDFEKRRQAPHLGGQRLRLGGRLDGAPPAAAAAQGRGASAIGPGKEIEPPEPTHITVRAIVDRRGAARGRRADGRDERRCEATGRTGSHLGFAAAAANRPAEETLGRRHQQSPSSTSSPGRCRRRWPHG